MIESKFFTIQCKGKKATELRWEKGKKKDWEKGINDLVGMINLPGVFTLFSYKICRALFEMGQ